MKILLFCSLLVMFGACTHPVQQVPIDRKALVSRNNPQFSAFDSLASLSVGNGEFAFTVDITGLQTALDSKVNKNGVEALHSTDALRISGTTLSLYKGDGTFESVVTQDTVYTLPNASATVLGGIKVGTNLSIDANGVLSANDTNVSFSEISGKPTNLSGYGITDAYTKTEVDTMVGDIASALDTINGQVI